MEVFPLSDLSPRRIIVAILCGFFALSALVYGRAVMQSEFVRWDDGMLVYENPVIRDITPKSVARIFSMYDPELYIPLTFLSYQIDYQIGGIAPFQYHLTSFLFHTLNALLVAWFAVLFFMGAGIPACQQAGKYARSQDSEFWLGIFCGLLFLLHPLHTEAVMWVSGRKDVLSTFFFLLTLIYWMRWRNHPIRRWYLMAIGFFALALLSKVMAITLPVILLLLDWRDGRSGGRSGATPLQAPTRIRDMFTEKISFFALSLIFGLIGIGGKTGVVASSSTWEKMIMAGKSSLFYLQKIVWPDFFSLLYPYHKEVTIMSPDFYVPILIWSVIAVLVFLSLKKTRDIAFGFAFFFITVGPTFINFTKGGDLDVYFASDRYAYIPSIGIFIALITVGDWILRKIRADSKQIRIGLASVIVVVLGFLAYQQSQVWKTTYSLLSHVLIEYPESHVAHNNIANAWRLEGKLDDAIAEFQKALAIKKHSKIYANLGAVYRKQGKIDEALTTYQEALALDPDGKEALMGRGLVWFGQKDFAKAEADFQHAITTDQRYLEAHTNLGAVYMTTGRTDDAIREYRIALVINPFYPDASYNLGVALTQKGLNDEAMQAFTDVIGEAPTFIPARINLGLLLYNAGDHDGARAQFEAILKIDPNNASATKALEQIGAQ